MHQIQNLRKEAGFKIENTIELAIEPEIDEKILNKFKDYIMKETLTRSLVSEFKEDMYVKEARVEGKKIRIGMRVVGSIV